MKRILLTGAMMGLIVLAQQHTAQSAEAPWCASFATDSSGSYDDCRYRSIEDCRRAVIAGNRGVCTQNPRWPGWYPRRSRR